MRRLSASCTMSSSSVVWTSSAVGFDSTIEELIPGLSKSLFVVAHNGLDLA